MSVTISGMDELIRRFGAAAAAAADPALVATVGSAVTYADFVERGTSRMTARPYLAPALAANMDAIEHALALGLYEAVERGDAGAVHIQFHDAVGGVERFAKAIVRVRSGTLRDSIHTEFGV